LSVIGPRDFAYFRLGPVIGPIRGGQMVALAVAARKRTAILPEIPAIIEAGYADATSRCGSGCSFRRERP
jgi:tripartite-type tricarboxylate transporter receptor subunit TctC